VRDKNVFMLQMRPYC